MAKVRLLSAFLTWAGVEHAPLNHDQYSPFIFAPFLRKPAEKETSREMKSAIALTLRGAHPNTHIWREPVPSR